MKRELFDSAQSFKVQYSLLDSNEISIDIFSGGGGASTGLEIGLKKPVFAAVNHNPKAIAMHEANHPHTTHYIQDVFAVDPFDMTKGHPVGWMHASPDCTHHSQAAGGQPRKKAIRDLPWVIIKFAGKVRPRIISMENVKQMLQWCPLIAKRDKATGLVITLDQIINPITGKKSNRIAEPGEIVPVHNQFLIPNPRLKGKTWQHFINSLERLGYKVEWRILKACDYGAPTKRERLFLVARNDGKPIVWPEPTHFEKPQKGQLKWRSAAECIDFTDLGKSIFDRPKPLATATMNRIAKGLKKFVIDSDNPFIVTNTTGHTGSSLNEPIPTITGAGNQILIQPMLASVKDHHALLNPVMVPYLAGSGGPKYSAKATAIDQPVGTLCATNHKAVVTSVLIPFLTEFANASNQRNMACDKPLSTICAQVKGGHHGLVVPVIIHAGYGEGTTEKPRWSHGCNSVEEPLGTVTASGGGRAVASSMLVKFRHNSEGQSLFEPMPTITAGGNAQRPAGAPHALGLASSIMVQANGGFNNTAAHDLRKPMSTITNKGSQQQLTSVVFTQAYYGDKRPSDHRAENLEEPLRTISTANRHSLITATLSKEDLEGALRVAAFLINYYGNGDARDITQPADTLTTKDRLALVTVYIKGEPHVIVDIRLRMLKPRELYRAQGFPDTYIIDRGLDGTPLTISDQVHMCGNSVSPPPKAAIAAANYY